MHPGRPRHITSRYLNEEGSGGVPIPALSISQTDSFHSFTRGDITVNAAALALQGLQVNPSGFTTLYVNIITTVINGITRRDYFANYNIELVDIDPMVVTGGVAPIFQMTTLIGTGTPNPLPNDTIASYANFCTAQFGTTGKVMPGIFNVNGDGTATLTMYNMEAGNNQRGQVSRCTAI